MTGTLERRESTYLQKALYAIYLLGATLLIQLIVARSGFVLSLYASWVITIAIFLAWAIGKLGQKISPLIPPLVPALVIGLVRGVNLPLKIE